MCNSKSFVLSQARLGTVSSCQGYLALIEQIEHAFDKVVNLVVCTEITDPEHIVKLGISGISLISFLWLFEDVHKPVTYSIWNLLDPDGIKNSVTVHMTYSEAATIMMSLLLFNE